MVESLSQAHGGGGAGSLGMSSGPTWSGSRGSEEVRASSLHRNISLTSGKGAIQLAQTLGPVLVSLSSALPSPPFLFSSQSIMGHPCPVEFVWSQEHPLPDFGFYRMVPLESRQLVSLSGPDFIN